MTENAKEVLKQAMRLLAKESLTKGELRHVLQQNQYGETLIDTTLQQLSELEVLSDGAVVNHILQQNPERGNHWLLNQMRERGIDYSLARRMLSLINDESERAERTAQRQWQQIKVRGKEKRLAKLNRILSKRGFDRSVCSSIVTKYKKQVEDMEAKSSSSA